MSHVKLHTEELLENIWDEVGTNPQFPDASLSDLKRDSVSDVLKLLEAESLKWCISASVKDALYRYKFYRDERMFDNLSVLGESFLKNVYDKKAAVFLHGLDMVTTRRSMNYRTDVTPDERRGYQLLMEVTSALDFRHQRSHERRFIDSDISYVSLHDHELAKLIVGSHGTAEEIVSLISSGGSLTRIKDVLRHQQQTLRSGVL